MQTPIDRRDLVVVTTVPETINSFVADQLVALGEAGWSVHVVCSPGYLREAVILESESVTRIPMRRDIAPASDVVALAKLFGHLIARRPEVVVGSTPKAALLAMISSKLARVPVRVLQLRGARWDEMPAGLTKGLLTLLDRLAATNATDVVAVSPSLADLMERKSIVRRRPVVLGAGGSKGVDRGVFFPDPGFVFHADRPRLGFLGRLAPDKGLDTAISALDHVRRNHPGATLTVIGAIEGNHQQQLLSLERLKQPGVQYLGRLEAHEISQRMRRWDALLFPSSREGLPNAVIEAAACGCPTVGWRVTGVRDAVLDGDSGRLVTLGDVKAFNRAVDEVLDPENHDVLRQGAIRRAEVFDSERVTAAWVAYLGTISEGVRRRRMNSRTSRLPGRGRYG